MKKVIDLIPNRKEHCFLIKEAFSPEFCNNIIHDKKDSFKKASTHYPTSYRNNDRQVIDNKQFSKELFLKIKQYLPKTIHTEGISQKESGIWELQQLNSRLRVCRYLPNQYFNKHLDGIHYVSHNIQSKLTFMIYLNGQEDFKGGNTLFFKNKTDEFPFKSYTPEKGDLIIFDHNLWHSGALVTKGIKYVLRSDIIYKKEKVNLFKNIDFAEGHLGYIWNITSFNNYYITSGRDKKIKIWSRKGSKISELKGHDNSILKIIPFSKTQFISASRDKTINIWKEEPEYTFKLEHKIKHHKATVLSLCKINSEYFLSADANGTLNQIDTKGNLIKSIQAHKEWIWDIQKIDKEHFVTICEDGSLKIWLLNTLKECINWQEKSPINAVAIDGTTLFIGTFEGKIISFKINLKNKSLIKLNEKNCHTGIIRKLKVKNNFLYSAGEDNLLQVWNKKQLHFIKSYPHKNFVQDMIITDTSIISASYEGEIKKFTIHN